MHDFLKNIYRMIRTTILRMKYSDIFQEVNNLKIMSDEQTIDQCIDFGKSVSRYGEGEIKWIMQSDEAPAFQKNDDRLSKELIEILKIRDDNLIICLPSGLVDCSKLKVASKQWWTYFLLKYWGEIRQYIDMDYCYGDSSFTRFYMSFRDKAECSERIAHIKRIWGGKKVLIVEGEKTKIGVGNDLLSNSIYVKRVICPAVNAFSKIDTIYSKVLSIKEAYDYDIVLIALGPTATVLAAWLSKDGIQSIDIGHLDIEYEWYRNKATSKIRIPGKYVNEAGDNADTVFEEINDAGYQNSIICDLS